MEIKGYNENSAMVLSRVYQISARTAIRFNKFKFVTGNRAISRDNVNRIKKSFKKHGWIGEPILVDKDFNIISGQHRFIAACELDIPIKYMFTEDELTLEAIQDMSQAVKKWTKLDVAQSYADQGNVNYINFMLMYQEFVKERKILSLNVIIAVITRRYTADSFDKILSNGELKVTVQDMQAYIRMLSDIEDCVESIRHNKKLGRFDFICKAVLFMLDYGADKKRLKDKIEKNMYDIHSVSNVEQALELLEDVYNRRAKDKMYFLSEYRRYKNEIALKKYK